MAGRGRDRKRGGRTKKYIAELEEDIVTVDGLIAFAQSEAGAKVFGGEEAAKGVAAHGQDLKKQGQNTATVRHVRRWKQFWRRKTGFFYRKHE